jgi:hypothetical protein
MSRLALRGGPDNEKSLSKLIVQARDDTYTARVGRGTSRLGSLFLSLIRVYEVVDIFEHMGEVWMRLLSNTIVLFSSFL